MVVRERDHIWLIVLFRGVFHEADRLGRTGAAIVVQRLLYLAAAMEADRFAYVL